MSQSKSGTNAPQACIFCAIASGRLPASLVYQDEHWLALMDLHPIREGHALIVPRRHLSRLWELEPAQRQQLFALAEALVRAQERAGYAAGGANLLLNDGVAANQHIPHLHLHCIPRRGGDTAGFGVRLLARTFGLFGRGASRARLDTVASALRAGLENDPPMHAGGSSRS